MVRSVYRAGMSDHRVPSGAALLDTMPFARTCGIELTEAGPERVTGFVAWAPERCTAGDVMHGGVIMALADSLGGACAFLRRGTNSAPRFRRCRGPSRNSGGPDDKR
jgi:acyl-coenzyme A thioesterase PaaI-like protein